MSATAVYEAFKNDSKSKCKMLKVNNQNPNGETALHIACRGGDMDVAKKLLEAGAKETKTDINGDIPLHTAVTNGQQGLVLFLLGIHAGSGGVHSSQLKDLVNNEGETALHIAASMGHAHIMNDLLLAGWNPNVGDKCGRTCIHHACIAGHLAAIKQLALYCDRRGSQHDPDDMSLSTEKGYEHIPIYWVVNCTDKDGKTPLHYACEAGSMELVEELCKLGEDPKLMTTNDGGCLHLAASSGCINLVLFLIETCHIDPSLKGHYGENILHRACANGRTELVQKLIEKKYADIHAQDAIGLTPLHWAMINQQKSTALILINYHHCSPLSINDVTGILENGLLQKKHYLVCSKILEAFLLISINDREKANVERVDAITTNKGMHQRQNNDPNTEEGKKRDTSDSDRHSGNRKGLSNHLGLTVTLRVVTSLHIEDWYRLGLQLDIDDQDLMLIKVQYGSDSSRCKSEMFRKWLRSSKPLYHDLKKALEKLQFNSAIEELNEKLTSEAEKN